MRAIAWLLRVFCYLHQTAFSLLLLGLGGLALLAGARNMKLQSLPWEGSQLNDWLIGLGLLGLVSVFLAFTNRFRILLVLWSLFMFGLVVKAVFFSPAMTFSGQDDFRDWLWLTGSAGVALIGSFLVLPRRRV
jgi:hypothetical protein